MELIIDEDYKQCLPALTEEEYRELESSVLKDGVLNPIIVWDKVIIDGHNRYDICKIHGITDFPIKEIKFNSKDEALEWILRNQLGRRNLTDFQRNRIALKYEDIIAKRMKERQRQAGKEFGRGKDNRLALIDANEENKSNKEQDKIGSDQLVRTYGGTTREEVAKIAGTSQGSVQRTKKILEKGTPEQIKRAEQGGRGNGQSTIVKEISMKEKGIETITCTRCGRVLPATDFPAKGMATCNKCYKKIMSKNRLTKDFKGNPIKVDPEVEKMTAEQLIGDLYDTEKERPYLIEDLEDELNANIEDFESSIQTTLKLHLEVWKDTQDHGRVSDILTALQNEIQKWKEGKLS